MIEKISIRNFQAQREFNLEIGDSNITTIVGESDIGKSSTIRAIIWCLTNQVDDKNFITWGQTECSVTLVVDGVEITRLRNKKENVYILNGIKYACLRQDVPPEIQDVLRIGIDSLQKQFDSVFWFSLTGGELAKKMNAIVNLDSVDFSFNELAARMRSIKAERDLYEERLKKREEILPKFDKIPPLEEKLSICKRLQNKISERSDLQARIGRSIFRADNLSHEIQVREKTVKTAENWLGLFRKLKQNKEKQSRLSTIIRKIESIQTNKEIFNAPSELLDEIELLFQKTNTSHIRARSLKGIIRDVESCRHEIFNHEKKLASAKKELDKAMEGSCPLCGRKDHITIGDAMNEACIHYTLQEGVVTK